MTRLLVCGDRYWNDRSAIHSVLSTLKDEISLVITGGATGADTLAHQVALELNLPTKVFPADWAKYGRAAGPIRNRQMLTEGQPTCLLAFHNDLTTSRGTKNMILQAQKSHLSCWLYSQGNLNELPQL